MILLGQLYREANFLLIFYYL